MHAVNTHSFNMYILLGMLLLIYYVLLSNSLIIIGKVGAKYVTKVAQKEAKLLNRL